MSDSANITIDVEKISSELKVRPEILERLILSFSNTLAERIKTLETAVAQEDVATMRSVLHEIKGTAGNLRLEFIKSAESVMHEAVKAGEPKEKLEGYFKVLKEKSEALTSYVNNK